MNFFFLFQSPCSRDTEIHSMATINGNFLFFLVTVIYNFIFYNPPPFDLNKEFQSELNFQTENYFFIVEIYCTLPKYIIYNFCNVTNKFRFFNNGSKYIVKIFVRKRSISRTENQI